MEHAVSQVVIVAGLLAIRTVFYFRIRVCQEGIGGMAYKGG